jgi:hypothetical protein
MGCYAEALNARHLALNKDTRQLSTSPQNSASAVVLVKVPPVSALHYSNYLKRWNKVDITVSPREDSQGSKASRPTTTAASPLALRLSSKNMAAGARSAPQGLRWFFLQRSPTNTKIRKYDRQLARQREWAHACRARAENRNCCLFWHTELGWSEGGYPYLGPGPKCGPSTEKNVPKYGKNRTQTVPKP